MGNRCSQPEKEAEKEAARRSAWIDRQINEDGKKLARECKILLLGTSGSGKSMIVKQMRLIHQDSLCYDTMVSYREDVYYNILHSAQAVAAAMHKFKVEPADPSNVPTLNKVLEYDLDAELRSPTCSFPFVFPAQLADAIHRLWKDQSVSEFVDNYHSQFSLMDSAAYFFAEAQRIGSVDYVPTETDILRCEQRSKGIVETRFNVPPMTICLLDVGGQRSERKKWIYCFENVTSVLFCVALSDYDQNEMAESLVLFDSVINSRWFLRTSIILFLTKIDIFRDKLKRVPLERYFQEYTGGPNVNKATKYILWRFMQANRAKLSVYPHITQATDMSNLRLVFSAVANTVIRNSLQVRDIL